MASTLSDLPALVARLDAARTRLDAMAALLSDTEWIGPYFPVVNPPRWEYGHIVWFEEHWCLRQKAGMDPGASPLLAPLEPSVRPWTDWLYDSSRIPHKARWQAPVLSVPDVIAYGIEVREKIRTKLAAGLFDDHFSYFLELSLNHELMHTEAWWMMWQWRGLAPPYLPTLRTMPENTPIAIAKGAVTLGSPPERGFVFDNEKWAHDMPLDPFEIDSRPVTCGEFMEFMAAGGYETPSWWSEAGRQWLATRRSHNPLYWRCEDDRWKRRRFDQWVNVVDAALDEPILHVSRFEAEAYAAWRGRRLPTAAEWVRASSEPAFRLGQCWEWTATWFAPYPDFTADPYKDYSVPWFDTHAELRGAGCMVTDPGIARPTYRNFFLPDRRDPFVGFRTAKDAA
ncbi:MAG: SUMF1/EgtB/PvdO family nonheme iron enzyme [Burkholderiales bacterium]